MIYREIMPLPLLRGLVKNYLLVNLKSKRALPITHYPTRIEQALVFFARGHILSANGTGLANATARNALFGQQTSRLDFHSMQQEDFLMLMVVFEPGGLYRFLGNPAFELTNHYCDASAFLGNELNAVNDAIANAPDYQSMIDHIDLYLINKLSRIKAPNQKIDLIPQLLNQRPEHFALNRLAFQAGLSIRQLERKFQERFGLTPKMYHKICRFNKAIACKQNNPTLDWLTIALQLGYTDYNHLAKDFKQLGSTTPARLLTELWQGQKLSEEVLSTKE